MKMIGGAKKRMNKDFIKLRLAIKTLKETVIKELIKDLHTLRKAFERAIKRVKRK